MEAKAITPSVIYPMGTLAHCPECATLCSYWGFTYTKAAEGFY